MLLSTYFVLACSLLHAQDPGFSQYYATPHNVNPAFAGDDADMSFGVNVRQYQNKFVADYNLAQISGFVPFNANFLYGKHSKMNHNSGVAASVYREATAGDGNLNSFGAVVSLAHGIQLERQHFLSMGIQAAYVRKTQGDNFEWGSQYSEDFGYDPNIIPDVGELYDLFTQFPTIGVGLEYFYRSKTTESYFKKNNFDAYCGIAAFNVNRPNQSFFNSTEARVPISFKVNGGLKYYATKSLALFPTVLWINQNMLNQINVGLYATIHPVKGKKVNNKTASLIMGVWYRVQDSFIASLGFSYSNFNFAVSYDFNATNFSVNNMGKGATEITLKYSIPYKVKDRKYLRGSVYPSF